MARSGEHPAVRAEGDGQNCTRTGTQRRAERLARPGVPEVHEVVVSTRGEDVAARAERDTLDRVRDACREVAETSAGSRVPRHELAVFVAAGDEHAPIGTEGDCVRPAAQPPKI